METDMEYEGNLYATGTCFDDAVEIIKQEALRIGRAVRHKYKIVHGVCLHEDGERYAHAWIEDEDENVAYDMKLTEHEEKVAVSYKREDFYKVMRVTVDTVRYTLDEVLLLEKTTGLLSGPYLERYRDLTTDGKKKYPRMV